VRFLLLIKHDEQRWLAEPQPHKEQIFEEYRALLGELARSGSLVEADQCTASGNARAVRMREGKASIEQLSGRAAEQIAGFVLVEVGSREDALEISARIPSVRTGSVEVWSISPRQQAQAK
jgi:hypothetical protein